MAVFATQEWLDEIARLLNEDADYAEGAKHWEGDFLYIIEPDELQPEPSYYYIDLYHGKCRKATVLKDPSEVKAEFELSATYTNWKKILTGELDGMKANLYKYFMVRSWNLLWRVSIFTEEFILMFAEGRRRWAAG